MNNKTYTDYYKYDGNLVDSNWNWNIPIWLIYAYQRNIIYYENLTLCLKSLKDSSIKKVEVGYYFILTDGYVEVVSEDEFNNEYELLDGEFTYSDYKDILDCIEFMCNSYLDTFPETALKYKAIGYKFYISYPKFKTLYDKENESID